VPKLENLCAYIKSLVRRLRVSNMAMINYINILDSRVIGA
jgi:hypothetical protein